MHAASRRPDLHRARRLATLAAGCSLLLLLGCSTPCLHGPCVLASADHPSALTAQGGEVFWSSGADLLDTRGTVASSLSSSQAVALAANSKTVFWAGQDGRLLAIDRGTGASRLLVAGSSITAVAADETHLAYVEGRIPGQSVLLANVDGSQVLTLAADQDGVINDIALDGADVYWVTTPTCVPLTGSCNLPGGTLMHARVDNGQVTLRRVWTAPDGAGSNALTVVHPSVFWVDNDANVWEASPSGGAPATLADESGASPRIAATSIVSVGVNLYWIESLLAPTAHDRLLEMPLAGGRPKVLADGLGAYVFGLAVDGKYVYWADFDAGRVMETPK